MDTNVYNLINEYQKFMDDIFDEDETEFEGNKYKDILYHFRPKTKSELK